MQLEVLVTTTTNKVLSGVIFDDGSLGIYDAVEDRYYRREWHLFKSWRPLPS